MTSQKDCKTCKHGNNGKSCGWQSSFAVIMIDGHLQCMGWTKKKGAGMTNQEKMQRMSKDELTIFLCDLVQDISGCECCPFSEDCSTAHNGAYIWLGKEAE